MLSNGLLLQTTLLLDMYPSKDGKLFTTKEQRDAHDASIPAESEYIEVQPYSALLDYNQSILNHSS